MRKRGSEVLTRLVDRKTDRLPYPRLARIEGRNADGTSKATILGGNCEHRLGITGGRTGEVVSIEPVGVGSRGTAGVPRSSFSGSLGGVWIERLERAELGLAEASNELLAGEEFVTATVTGDGFTSATDFLFLLPTFYPNPHITVLDQRYIDAQHVELDLRIEDGAVEIDEAAPLAAAWKGNTMASNPYVYTVSRDQVIDPVFGTLHALLVDESAPPRLYVATYKDTDGSVLSVNQGWPLQFQTGNHALPKAILSEKGKAILLTSRGTFADQYDTLEEAYLRTGATGSSYQWPIPNGRAYGERSNITPPLLLEGEVYWAELEPNDADQEVTWQLVKAQEGALGSVSVVASLVEPYSLIATPGAGEQVLSPHMRYFGSRLLWDGTDFLLDANLDYWTGFQMKSAIDTSIRFSASPVREPYETGPVSYEGIVQGDLIGWNVRILPTSPRSTETVWSAPESASEGHGIIGRRHFGIWRGTGGSFTFYEGDLDTPDGAVNIIPCADASEEAGVALTAITAARI